MIRVRILHHTVARLTFAPGDELLHHTMTPELQALLANVGRDGARVALLVEDETEVAVAPSAPEVAVTRGRRSTRVLTHE